MNKGLGLWNEVKIEQLRELWDVGFSAREIAEQLGPNFTRAGVIGKAWRLKLEPRASPVCPPNPKRIPVPRPDPPPPPPAPRLLSVDQQPRMRRLQLVELESHHCKWPYGDPHTQNFYFCGSDAPVGQVYCDFHHRQAFARQRQGG
jgi:GcrA cell cycle regulator